MVEIKVIGTFDAALENKFNKDIKTVEDGGVLIMDITSNGGDMEVLTRMTQKILALKERGVTILTFVPEYANSAGFFLFLLGDHREMEETASVHYHVPRVKLGEGFVGTKETLTEVVSSLSKYQDFTSSLFRASCDVDDELFSLLENSELPMKREHLISLGIIN